GGAQPRLDLDDGRARPWPQGSPRPGRGRRRLPCLPHPGELPRPLSEVARPDALDRGPEAADGAGASEGRAVSRSTRLDAWLWLTQRLSAAVLAGAVALHLATIIYAVKGGLRAADILARLHGSTFWLLFYGAFVIAVALHAPI